MKKIIFFTFCLTATQGEISKHNHEQGLLEQYVTENKTVLNVTNTVARSASYASLFLFLFGLTCKDSHTRSYLMKYDTRNESFYYLLGCFSSFITMWAIHSKVDNKLKGIRSPEDPKPQDITPFFNKGLMISASLLTLFAWIQVLQGFKSHTNHTNGFTAFIAKNLILGYFAYACVITAGYSAHKIYEFYKLCKAWFKQ